MFVYLGVHHNSVISLCDLSKLVTNLINIYEASKTHKSHMYYYELAGLLGTFTENQIIFTIHMPTLSNDTLQCLD